MKGRDKLENKNDGHSNKKKQPSKKRDRPEVAQEYHYPPKSRPISQLKFQKPAVPSLFDTKKIGLATRSVPEQAAPVQKADPPSKKRRRQQRAAARSKPVNNVVQPPAKDKTYFFKPHSETNNTDKELEAYHAAICRFHAGDEYVSPVNAYYDKKTKRDYKGVASRAMDGFKSNHDDPLKPSDTIIECLKEPHLRNNIIGAAKFVLEDLDESSKNVSKIASFFDPQRHHSAIQEKRAALKDLITQLTDAPYHQVADTAIEKFDARMSEIKNVQSNKHDVSLDAHLQNYSDQSKIGWGVYTTVEDLEAAEKTIKQAGIDLAAIPDGEFVKLNVNGRHCSYLASDLRNYTKIKGLAISFTTRYLMQEGDMNNTNFAKDGKMVDFGMTNLPIHNMLRDIASRDLLLRQRHLDTIDFTERNIRHFPMLKDTKPYYWPTEKSFISDILIDTISHYLKHYNDLKDSPADNLRQQIVFIVKNVLEVIHEYRDSTNTTIQNLAESAMGFITQLRALMASRDAKDIEAEDFTRDLYGIANMLFDSYIMHNRKEIRGLETELRKEFNMNANLFSAKDREVMRSLATNPVFEYFKFKTILKYILSETKMYEAFARLYISPDKDIHSPFYSGPMVDALIDHETDKIYAAYDLASKMPEFLTFMCDHSESAFEMIMAEESAFKERTMQKHAKHPEGGHYKALADAIDLAAFEERFRILFGDRLLKLAR